MKYGYARILSAGRSLEPQLTKLRDAGCESIFEECTPAAEETHRPVLVEMLNTLKEGDAVVVTSRDRLSRQIDALGAITHLLELKGVTLISLQ